MIDQMTNLTSQLLAEVDPASREPHSNRAEYGLIACLLADNREFDVVHGILKGSDAFYQTGCRDIYEVFRWSMAGSNRHRFEGKRQAIHTAYILNRLEETGLMGPHTAEALEGVAGVRVLGSEAVGFATVVSKLSVRRAAWRAHHKLASMLGDTSCSLDRMLEQVATLSRTLTTDGDVERRASPAYQAQEMLEHIERNLSGERSPVIATGIEPLDALLLGGFRPGNGYTLGAMTGQGKTTLANAVLGALRNDVACNVHTAEMSTLQNLARTLNTIGATDHDTLYESTILDPYSALSSESARDRFRDRIEDLMEEWRRSKVHVYTQGTCLHVEEIIAKARLRRIEYPDAPLVVIVDYIQHCRYASRRTTSRAEEIQDAVYELNALAKSLDAVVILLTQFTTMRAMQTRPIPKPTANMAKWGAAIEEASPYFLTYHRPWAGDPEKSPFTILELQKGRYSLPRVPAQRHVLIETDMRLKQYRWIEESGLRGFDVEQLLEGQDLHTHRMGMREWRDMQGGVHG